MVKWITIDRALALALLLSGLAFMAALLADPVPPLPPSSPGPALHPAANPIQPPPPGWPDSAVRNAIARPLFAIDRKPYAEGSGRQIPADQSSTLPRLMGVVVKDGTARALFELDGGTAASAVTGGTVGGWTVEKIDGAEVELQANGRAITLSIGPRREPDAAAAQPLAQEEESFSDLD